VQFLLPNHWRIYMSLKAKIEVDGKVFKFELSEEEVAI
jgi:hypothetical protein